MGSEELPTGGTRAGTPEPVEIEYLVPGNGWFLLHPGDMTLSGAPEIGLADWSQPFERFAESRTVFGTVLALKPSRVLPPGEYQINAPTLADYQVGGRMTVVEEAMIEPPILSATPVARWELFPTQRVNCVQTEDGMLDTTTAIVRAVGHIYVTPHFTTPTPALASQFLYRVFPIDGEKPEEWSNVARIEVGPYETQAEEYCFGVERLDIATGEVSAEAELTPTCVPHGELQSLAEHDVEIEDWILNRYDCELPGEPEPNIADADASEPEPNIADADASEPEPDAEEREADASDARAEGGGCTAVPATRAARPAWLLLALGTLAALRRRSAKRRYASLTL